MALCPSWFEHDYNRGKQEIANSDEKKGEKVQIFLILLFFSLMLI